MVTTWDWGDEKQYLHDLIASGPAQSDGQRLRPAVRLARILDRLHPDPRSQDQHRHQLQGAGARCRTCRKSLGPGHAAMAKPLGPSAYWGEEKIWDTKINNHNSMIDQKGRVWLAAAVRGPKNPDFCKKGSDHPSAKLFPLERDAPRSSRCSIRKTMKYTFVDTCFRPITCNSPTTPTTRCGRRAAAAAAWSAGSTPRCSTRPAMRRSRRAGRRSSSTPTATASATIMSSPTSRSIPPRTSASPRCSTR